MAGKGVKARKRTYWLRRIPNGFLYPADEQLLREQFADMGVQIVLEELTAERVRFDWRGVPFEIFCEKNKAREDAWKAKSKTKSAS